MKILEAQSAILSNFEVFHFLQDQKTAYETTYEKKKGSKEMTVVVDENGKKVPRKGPSNFETITKDTLAYLQAPPSPMTPADVARWEEGQEPWQLAKMQELLAVLHEYNLTKAEVMMILNLRPSNPGVLNTIVEEMEIRLSEEQQEQVIQRVAEVLGSPPGKDVAMEDDE